MTTQYYSRISLTSADQGVLLDDTWTTVHATDSLQEIWLYANNTSSSDVTLDIGWCSTSPTSNTGSTITVGVPGQTGLLLVVPGLLIPASLYIVAQAATADVVVLYGFANKIETV